MNEKEKYEILANLIGFFGEKKWLLSKFLIDNNAISDSFLKKIKIYSSSELNNFQDINTLNSYLEGLIEEELSKEVDLQNKLSRLLEDEKYEEAAKLRDLLNRIRRSK